MTILVLGLGNDLRRDDGIGPAVARVVAARADPDVRVSVSEADPTELLGIWSGADLVVIVDAVLCDPARPGTVHRMSPNELADGQAETVSTHGFGLVSAFRLGAVLGRSPRAALVYAVEVADLGRGRGLSPSVARAVVPTASAVLAEIAKWHVR